MKKEPLKQEGYDFMSAAFEVYNEMGNGFLENVYQECLERELELRNIAFERKPELSVIYKDNPISKKYVSDLLVFEDIIVELKSVRKLAPEHEAQLLNYLKITKKPVGYLINFGSAPQLEWKRMILC